MAALKLQRNRVYSECRFRRVVVFSVFGEVLYARCAENVSVSSLSQSKQLRKGGGHTLRQRQKRERGVRVFPPRSAHPERQSAPMSRISSVVASYLPADAIERAGAEVKRLHWTFRPDGAICGGKRRKFPRAPHTPPPDGEGTLLRRKKVDDGVKRPKRSLPSSQKLRMKKSSGRQQQPLSPRLTHAPCLDSWNRVRDSKRKSKAVRAQKGAISSLNQSILPTDCILDSAIGDDVAMEQLEEDPEIKLLWMSCDACPLEDIVENVDDCIRLLGADARGASDTATVTTPTYQYDDIFLLPSSSNTTALRIDLTRLLRAELSTTG